MLISTGLHRSDLHRVLEDSLPPQAKIFPGYQFTHAVQTENKVVAYFANGEEVEADVLIGT